MNNKMKSHKFFSRVYTDQESERLSDEYDVRTCPTDQVLSSLGKTEYEIGAYKLLSISKCFGEFVGINREALDDIYWENNSDLIYIAYLDREYIRTAKNGNLEILFPTEELLINQKVRKK